MPAGPRTLPLPPLPPLLLPLLSPLRPAAPPRRRQRAPCRAKNPSASNRRRSSCRRDGRGNGRASLKGCVPAPTAGAAATTGTRSTRTPRTASPSPCRCGRSISSRPCADPESRDTTLTGDGSGRTVGIAAGSGGEDANTARAIDSLFLAGLCLELVGTLLTAHPFVPRQSKAAKQLIFRLHFEKQSREEIEQRKKLMQGKVIELIPETELEVDIDTIYKPGSVLDFPKRSPWKYTMSKEQLLVQEEKAFREYLEKIYRTFDPAALSYFEHNLETWRQLWRVLEMSDIILLITDIRHPVLHFSPALYDYVTGEMKRNLILVLNKIDLAPPSLVAAWKHYFQQKFPQLHVLCFTSYPRDTQDETDPSTVFQKRRRRVRTMAVGPRQLLKACETITQGKVDLSSWREKMERDCAGSRGGEVTDEDEDEDETVAVMVEHQTDTAMELCRGPGELYKDSVLTLGCVGFPNVGKSSLINGLVGRKVVSVSRTPGHTKYFQTYFLTPTVKLCDCPGLIFPSLVDRQQQMLAGIYPVAQIQEPYSSVGYLAARIPVHTLLKLQHPEQEQGQHPEQEQGQHPEQEQEHGQGQTQSPAKFTAWDLCEAWAVKRGYRTAKAGRSDVYRAANSILRLTVDGRLCLCMRPPAYTAHKAYWLQHSETLEIAALQEAHRQQTKQSSEDEEEISSSDQEDDEKDQDADEEEEGEEGDGEGEGDRAELRPAPVSRGKRAALLSNKFAVLGEDEC